MGEQQIILVLEDDANDLFFMQRAFQKMGLTASVQFAHDGDEGISYLAGKGQFTNREKHPVPSVVITDLKMPLINGFEVLKWMRQHPDYLQTPAFVLSSSNLPIDREKAHECGATGYFTKPRRLENLLPLLEEIRVVWIEKLAQLRPSPR